MTTERESLSHLLELAQDLFKGTSAAPSVDELRFARSLHRKLQLHTASALAISDGVGVSTGESSLAPDWSSLEVLARACVETLLTFDLLFEKGASPDLAEFRFCAWMLAGFVQRQRFPTHSRDEEERRRYDAERIEHFRGRVQETSTFKDLTPKRGKQVLEGQEWRLTGLAPLTERIFGETFGRTIYSALSSYAHSTPLSISQMHEIEATSDENGMVDAAIMMIAKSMALMNEKFASFYPAADHIFRSHPQRRVNDEWVRLEPVDPHAEVVRHDQRPATQQ